MAEDLELLREKKGFICDMDGVIYHGNRLLPGVTDFVAWLQRENKSFLFLTNSSERSPKELQQKLKRMGLDVDVGIDGQEAFLHDFDFRPANGLDRRPELAVDIGRVEDVGIDQDEMAYTGPAQGFDDG